MGSVLAEIYGRGAVYWKRSPVAARGAAQKGFGLCGERLKSTQGAASLKGRGLCGAELASTQKPHGAAACLKRPSYGKHGESSSKVIRGSTFKLASGTSFKTIRQHHRKSAASGATIKHQRKFAACVATIKHQRKSAACGAVREHRMKSAACGATMKRQGKPAASGATVKRLRRSGLFSGSHAAEPGVLTSSKGGCWDTSALPPGAVDTLCVVGSAQEADSSHAERHPPAQRAQWAKVCARCCFLLWRQKGKTCVWMRPKPSFMSGAWGLGCIWCAAAKNSWMVQDCRRRHMKENNDVGRCNQAISRASVWSRYEIRSLRTTKAFTNAIPLHEITDLHRLSQKVFLSPQGHLDCPRDPRGEAAYRTAHNPESLSAMSVTCPPVKTVCDVQPVANPQTHGPQHFNGSDVQPVATSTAHCTVGSASDPFRGGVPQCQDWLDCWADTWHGVSRQGLVRLILNINPVANQKSSGRISK